MICAAGVVCLPGSLLPRCSAVQLAVTSVPQRRRARGRGRSAPGRSRSRRCGSPRVARTNNEDRAVRCTKAPLNSGCSELLVPPRCFSVTAERPSCYRSRREAAEIAVGRGSLETPLNASRFVHNAALSYHPPLRPFGHHPDAAHSPLKPTETASGC